MTYRLAFMTLALLGASLVLGCDGDPPDGSGGTGGTGGSEQGGGGDGAAGGNGGSTNQGGGGTGGTGGTGGGSQANELPPTEKNALFQWLKDGSYAGWAAESKIHASTGPHGGDVRTFVNVALLESLEAGNAAHPKGSATVKELYGSNTTLDGWAVDIKTDDDSAGGQGWYWYEIMSTTDGSDPFAAGNGVSLCYNCHGDGVDYFITPFPLQ